MTNLDPRDPAAADRGRGAALEDEEMTENVFAERPVLCLTCGKVHKKMIEVRGADRAAVHDIVKCPKCSKMAFTLNPFKTHFILEAMAKEIRQLRMDVFDLQAGFEAELDQ